MEPIRLAFEDGLNLSATFSAKDTRTGKDVTVVIQAVPGEPTRISIDACSDRSNKKSAANSGKTPEPAPKKQPALKTSNSNQPATKKPANFYKTMTHAPKTVHVTDHDTTSLLGSDNSYSIFDEDPNVAFFGGDKVKEYESDSDETSSSGYADAAGLSQESFGIALRRKAEQGRNRYLNKKK